MYCLNNDVSTDISQVGADWKKLFECSSNPPDYENQRLKWVDTWRIISDTTDDVGGGCGATVDDMGPVRLRKLVKRKNAYDINDPTKC